MREVIPCCIIVGGERAERFENGSIECYLAVE